MAWSGHVAAALNAIRCLNEASPQPSQPGHTGRTQAMDKRIPILADEAD
jgi:hypothetical protein